MNIFKPEDFVSCSPYEGQRKLVAEHANHIFREWISSQPLVVGNPADGYGGFKLGSRLDTHTARLVDIREIEKKPCEHVPDKPTFFIEWIEVEGKRCTHKILCKLCGVPLEPSGWRVKEE